MKKLSFFGTFLPKEEEKPSPSGGETKNPPEIRFGSLSGGGEPLSPPRKKKIRPPKKIPFIAIKPVFFSFVRPCLRPGLSQPRVGLLLSSFRIRMRNLPPSAAAASGGELPPDRPPAGGLSPLSQARGGRCVGPRPKVAPRPRSQPTP